MKTEQDLDTEHAYVWKYRHDCLYRIELSVLYHQKRERFFEACDKLAKFIAVIGGSWSLAKLGGDEWQLYVPAAITVTSTLSLVFAFSERARRHADLARSFRDLMARALAKGERDFSEEDVTQWMAATAALEASEPPALSALIRICQNELAVARGERQNVRPVRWYKRLLSQLFDFPARA